MKLAIFVPGAWRSLVFRLQHLLVLEFQFNLYRIHQFTSKTKQISPLYHFLAIYFGTFTSHTPLPAFEQSNMSLVASITIYFVQLDLFYLFQLLTKVFAIQRQLFTRCEQKILLTWKNLTHIIICFFKNVTEEPWGNNYLHAKWNIKVFDDIFQPDVRDGASRAKLSLEIRKFRK